MSCSAGSVAHELWSLPDENNKITSSELLENDSDLVHGLLEVESALVGSLQPEKDCSEFDDDPVTLLFRPEPRSPFDMMRNGLTSFFDLRFTDASEGKEAKYEPRFVLGDEDEDLERIYQVEDLFDHIVWAPKIWRPWNFLFNLERPDELPHGENKPKPKPYNYRDDPRCALDYEEDHLDLSPSEDDDEVFDSIYITDKDRKKKKKDRFNSTKPLIPQLAEDLEETRLWLEEREDVLYPKDNRLLLKKGVTSDEKFLFQQREALYKEYKELEEKLKRAAEEEEGAELGEVADMRQGRLLEDPIRNRFSISEEEGFFQPGGFLWDPGDPLFFELADRFFVSVFSHRESFADEKMPEELLIFETDLPKSARAGWFRNKNRQEIEFLISRQRYLRPISSLSKSNGSFRSKILFESYQYLSNLFLSNRRLVDQMTKAFLRKGLLFPDEMKIGFME